MLFINLYFSELRGKKEAIAPFSGCITDGVDK